MLGRTAFVVLLAIGCCPGAVGAAQRTEVTVVSGDLVHHALTNDLFHIGDLWMKVKPDTEFHRWLSQGIDRKVTITLTPNADRFADAKDTRILRGSLMHETAPNATPVVHILFLKDELTGSVGAVTFETADSETATKFDSYDDADVSIVIEIR